MIPQSIAVRASKIHIEQGLDIIEAVKMAIIEENKFTAELIDGKTDRAKKVKKHVEKTVFGLCNLI